MMEQYTSKLWAARSHRVRGTTVVSGLVCSGVLKMVLENYRISNEFYVDVAVDFAIKNDLFFKVFEVDQYICWGTPKDYENYDYWLSYFKNRLL